MTVKLLLGVTVVASIIIAVICQGSCGPGEALKYCPVDCKKEFCPTSEADTHIKCPSVRVCPPSVCKCKMNYRRALNGTCIPTTECPPFDCSGRPNEEFDACPRVCPNDDCFRNVRRRCIKFRKGQMPCYPNCRCLKNFKRLNGTCVPQEQCSGA